MERAASIAEHLATSAESPSALMRSYAQARVFFPLRGADDPAVARAAGG
jgi:hypothetical protein